jgi:hypothetical protein
MVISEISVSARRAEVRIHVEGQRRERERANSRAFGFLRRPLRHGFSAGSAQRTRTKGALVHVDCFWVSGP